MTVKVLGQSNPAATTLTTLYTVPGATSAVASSLVICNQDATQCTVRVAVRVAGAAITAKQYLYYDLPLPGNDTFVAVIGMALAATDVVSVYASSANVSFNLFGEETS